MQSRVKVAGLAGDTGPRCLVGSRWAGDRFDLLLNLLAIESKPTLPQTYHLESRCINNAKRLHEFLKYSERTREICRRR